MATTARVMIHMIRDATIVNFMEASILDTAQVDQIGKQLYELVDEMSRKKIILDFTKVKFLSSSALGVLLNLRKKAEQIKGQILICSMKDELRKVFKITNLDKMFKFFENEEAALAEFGISAAG